jgi:hypothetical protein
LPKDRILEGSDKEMGYVSGRTEADHGSSGNRLLVVLFVVVCLMAVAGAAAAD